MSKTTGLSERAAFLGLGTMGGPMAGHLSRAGVDLAGWNRTPGRPGASAAADGGATITASLADAVRGRTLILTCLGDVPDVEEVLLAPGGVVDHLEAGGLVVDTSTIGPKAAKDIGGRLATRGIAFVDAPISGGDVGARSGTLTVMCGGSEADFARAAPYLRTFGRVVRRCGPVGAGQAVKMVNQILCAIKTVAVAEGLALARQMDLAPELIIEVCGSGAAGSWSLSNYGPRIAAGELGPGFVIRHLLKDLGLALDGVDAEALPSATLARALFERAAELDDGQGARLGTHGVARLYE